MFGFGSKSTAFIDINLNYNKKKTMTIKEIDSQGNETPKKIPLFVKDEKISGKIDIKLERGRKLDHMGIRVELIGMIEVKSSSEKNSTFMCNGFDLEPSGTLYTDKIYDFSFDVFQKPYDSYYGKNIKLRYLVKTTIMMSRFSNPIIKENDIGVLTEKVIEEKEPTPINMEVGIEDLLNIKIEIPKNTYDLNDFVEGKIAFGVVKVLIKKMELNVVKKEIIGIGQKSQVSSEEINSFEIMDGCPIKEEEIPIRMYLNGVMGLSPTMTNVNNKFSVKYFLNLIILDELNRKYFKQSEIILFRQKL